MNRLVIGIMPQEKIRERVFAIARGEIKPGPNDPKIWFPSMKSLAEVLSDENRALLRIMQDMQPDSVTVLAHAVHREVSNLSRTLKTLENYGIVELRKEGKKVRPVAKATEFEIRAAA